MEPPRNTIANGLPFQSPFVPDGSFFSAADRDTNNTTSFSSFSHVIDVDDSLSGVFSTLNLSPPYFQNSSVGQMSQIGSSIAATEGFVHSLNMNMNMNMNSPRVTCSNLGVNNFLNRQRRFDYGFDFDQMKLLEIADKKLKFQRSDDYEQQNPCSCSKFQSQNHNLQFIYPWNLKELRGRIYTMAKDQNGCRVLQAMIEQSTMEDVEIVVSEVMDLVSDLMKDQFGNYLVQKLVALCNDDQKMRLILSLTEVPADIILVCMNPHGTRAVQKLLESLNPGQVKLVIKALYRGAATLAVDPNGHHVIQYCLINFNSDINKPILIEIANECYKIATDRSGCCVLQACVEHSRGEVRSRIINEIMANSVHLAEDPFGNYVLQHMVGLNIPELTALLVRQLQGHFASLSCNKYASNVVEKCLNESGEEMSTRIIMELVRSPNSSLLLVDPYANFVIQSALKVSKGFAHECLCGLISKNMLSMRTNLYGKKILERLEKKRANFA